MSLMYTAGARDASRSDRRGASRFGHYLVISVYAGFSVYCLLSLLFGPAGITTYRRLETRKAAMEANLAELGTIRQSLDSEMESLKSDPDRVALEARSLGYLRKDETAIILGEKTERIRPIITGKVLPYIEPAALNDLEIKEISFGAFLAVLALLLSPRGSASSRNHATPR
jgi:cell division protein FtsB